MIASILVFLLRILTSNTTSNTRTARTAKQIIIYFQGIIPVPLRRYINSAAVTACRRERTAPAARSFAEETPFFAFLLS